MLSENTFVHNQNTILFNWCSDETEADPVGRFFVENAGNTYISHTDIQWGRATDPDSWSPTLQGQIASLAREAMRNRCSDKTNSAIWVACATEYSALKGIAFVTLRTDAATPFAILEDLIVKSDARDCGIGSSFMDWIIAECQGLGLRQVFLESALHNERAHKLFHRHGFRSLSVVLARDI